MVPPPYFHSSPCQVFRLESGPTAQRDPDYALKEQRLRALLARRVERIRDPWGVFGLLIAGAGLIALLEIALLGRWLVVAQSQAESWLLAMGASELAGMSARFAVAALSIVFVPTLLLGARRLPPISANGTAPTWSDNHDDSIVCAPVRFAELSWDARCDHRFHPGLLHTRLRSRRARPIFGCV